MAAGASATVGGSAHFTITMTDSNLDANFTPTVNSGTVDTGACTASPCAVTVVGFSQGTLTLTVASGDVADLAGNTNTSLANADLTVITSNLSVNPLPMATSLNAAIYPVSGSCESTQEDVTVTIGTPDTTKTDIDCSSGTYSTTMDISSVNSPTLTVTATQSTNTAQPTAAPANDQNGPTSAPAATAPGGYVGGISYDLQINCNESGEQVSITGSGLQPATQTHDCIGNGLELVSLTLQQNVLLSSNSLTISSKDEHHNPAGSNTSVSFPVDTQGPTVNITDGGDIGVGGSATFTITVADDNLPSSWNYTPSVNLGGTFAPSTCTDNPCDLTVTGATAGSLTLTISANSISDNLGNTGPSSHQTQSLTVRPPAATITGTSITSSDSDSDSWYEAGDTVTLEVSFSEAVTVTGFPEIPVTLGSSLKTAVYNSGDSTSTLTFQFTIASGDEHCDGVISLGSLALPSGALIQSVLGGADTNNSGLSNSLSGVKVDAQVPTLSALTLSSSVYPSSLDGAQASWTSSDNCGLETSIALSTHNGTTCDLSNSVVDYQDIGAVTTFQPQSDVAPFDSPNDFTPLSFSQGYCLRVKVVDLAGNESTSASASWTPEPLFTSETEITFPDGTYAANCLEYYKSPHYDHDPANSDLGDGTYSIDPDGNGAITAYCDMTDEGWTLVAQRAGGSSANAETCSSSPAVSNLGGFMGATCGAVSSLAYGDSYSIGNSTVRAAIVTDGDWKFEQFDSSLAAADTDDTYIITKSDGSDLFPALTGTLALSRMSVDSVCDKDGSNCDSSGVEFLWLPDQAFENSSAATCDGTLNSASSLKGNYGYCHDGSATNAANSLFGDRSGYSETKAWGDATAQTYAERIWVR